MIEALAPATPTYRVLRDVLKQARAGMPAGNKALASRLRSVEVNLERQRWLPRQLPADRAWVNVADERLVLYRADQPVFSTRVVVGEDVERNQSPEFRATIDASFYNPPWVVPADIANAEILPKLGRDPNYLTRNKMVMLANGDVEQLPGPDAGLGLIMFDMPNRFDVYLHDTPDRYIFSRDNRRLSHGCIRVQNPREFASLLMDLPLDSIDQGIATGSTTRKTCKRRCRCSWSTRPPSSTPTGRCSSAPTSTTATLPSGESMHERPQGPVHARPRQAPRPTSAQAVVGSGVRSSRTLAEERPLPAVPHPGRR